MVMVKIICDSTCDLSPELLEKFDIQIVPLSIFINGKNYLDGIELTTPQLFDLIDKTKELPKTSAPSIESFREVFSRYSEMLYISVSSKLSASFQSSILALEGSVREKKTLIDSLNLSTGIGLLALKASELSSQGHTPAEIANQVQKDVDKVRTSFVIDTLDYLYKGGRCSAVELLVGSLLKIRPVIEVRSDGTLGIKEKIGGSRKKALNSLISDIQTKMLLIDPKRIFVTHCACPEDAEFLKSELSELEYFDEVLVTEAGSTIASHCGPKTIGILYMEK
jgi:DegV family protein with EDD domain